MRFVTRIERGGPEEDHDAAEVSITLIVFDDGEEMTQTFEFSYSLVVGGKRRKIKEEEEAIERAARRLQQKLQDEQKFVSYSELRFRLQDEAKLEGVHGLYRERRRPLK